MTERPGGAPFMNSMPQSVIDRYEADQQKTAAKHLDLYHRTTPEAAQVIREQGFGRGKENTGDLYFSTFRGDEDNAQGVGYGKGVVHVRVPRSIAEIDDEFPSGEEHYRIKHVDLRPEHVLND